MMNYQKRKESRNKAKRKAIKKRNELIWKIKSEKGCKLCGIRDPQVLVFAHRDHMTKSFEIGDKKSASLSKVFNEIAKCDVLCHNCHFASHRGGKEFLQIRLEKRGIQPDPDPLLFLLADLDQEPL